MLSSICQEQAGATESGGSAIGLEYQSGYKEQACRQSRGIVGLLCLGSVLRMLRSHAERLEFGCKYGGEIRCYLFNCGCLWSAA